MAKLKKNHFYYGAILDALCQYNPDASPKTNGKNEDDISYLFTFSDDDKQKLKSYNDKYDYPIFLYLLCKRPDLKDSEIIVLKYEEYQNVEENRAITIRIQKNKNYILLFKKGSKSPDNAYQIQRNRIENSLEDLIIHNNGNDMVSRICRVCKRRFVNKHQYKIIRKYCGVNKIVPELYIMDYPEQKSINNENEILGESNIKKAKDQSPFRDAVVSQLFVIEQDSDICPIHNCKMDIKVINFGVKLKDTVHFCKRCNKHIISRSLYNFLKNQTIKNSKRIIQNISFKKLDG